MQVKSTRYSRYQIAYHFVWIPKYRRCALKGSVKKRLEKILEETAEEYSLDILALEVQPDHVHFFVSAPPRYSPAELVKIFKGISGKKLLTEFPELRKLVKKDKLWAPSYYVGTAGSASAETIKRYIEECQERYGV